MHDFGVILHVASILHPVLHCPDFLSAICQRLYGTFYLHAGWLREKRQGVRRAVLLLLSHVQALQALCRTEVVHVV